MKCLINCDIDAEWWTTLKVADVFNQWDKHYLSNRYCSCHVNSKWLLREKDDASSLFGELLPLKQKLTDMKKISGWMIEGKRFELLPPGSIMMARWLFGFDESKSKRMFNWNSPIQAINFATSAWLTNWARKSRNESSNLRWIEHLVPLVKCLCMWLNHHIQFHYQRSLCFIWACLSCNEAIFIHRCVWQIIPSMTTVTIQVCSERVYKHTHSSLCMWLN